MACVLLAQSLNRFVCNQIVQFSCGMVCSFVVGVIMESPKFVPIRSDIHDSNALSFYIGLYRALMCGEAVIFPTDTVFGLGVSVQHAPSPEILYQIKQRSEHKPIAWLVDSISALDTYGKDIPSSAYVLAKTILAWPPYDNCES